MKIARIIGREVLDSRGNPTVEAEVHLDDGARGQAAVPSGASVGSYEAHELRDGDSKRYGGLGVMRAVENINSIIARDLVGLVISDQQTLDARLIALDGTNNKEHLGANAILAVSVACAKAGAISGGQPIFRYLGGEDATMLPVPQMNVINGGRHALDSTDFQEFMIVPVGAESFRQAMQMGLEVYQTLKVMMREHRYSVNVGDEGGFGLTGLKNEDALKILVQAIEKTNYRPGRDISLALDIAADELFKNGAYHFVKDDRTLTPEEMERLVEQLAYNYPLYSIEDPLQEDDWSGYQSLTSLLGQKIQIVGDDLFVTNQTRLQKGIDEKCANAILVKLNQIGTVSETIATVEMAKQHQFATIISHRSGETVDTFIADLAVALGAGQIKTGAPARGERTAKYNQLLRIEELLGPKAQYANLS